MQERYTYPSQGNAVAPSTAPTPDESASWIRDAVTESEQHLSAVHESITLLERRLDTVLTPEPPSTTTQASGKPTPAGSHLRGRVVILNEGWQHATERLARLRQRVEV